MYQSKMKSEETDHLFKAILSLKTEEECYRFFDDLCTFSEIEAMSSGLIVDMASPPSRWAPQLLST